MLVKFVFFFSLTKDKKYSSLNIENICLPPNIILSVPTTRVAGATEAPRTTSLAENALGS